MNGWPPTAAWGSPPHGPLRYPTSRINTSPTVALPHLQNQDANPHPCLHIPEPAGCNAAGDTARWRSASSKRRRRPHPTARSAPGAAHRALHPLSRPTPRAARRRPARHAHRCCAHPPRKNRHSRDGSPPVRTDTPSTQPAGWLTPDRLLAMHAAGDPGRVATVALRLNRRARSAPAGLGASRRGRGITQAA